MGNVNMVNKEPAIWGYREIVNSIGKAKIEKTGTYALWNDYIGIINTIISKHMWKAPKRVTKEELFQEGLISLISALRRYDNKRAKRSTYIWINIEGGIRNLIRNANIEDSRNSGKRAKTMEVQSEEAYVDACLDLESLLSPLDNEVLCGMIEKRSQREIAENLQIQQHMVQRSVMRVKQIGEEYYGQRNNRTTNRRGEEAPLSKS